MSLSTHRLTFLDAAEAVLQAANAPLSPSEIVDRALAGGLISSNGATPSQTMKAKLSTDVLRQKTKSRFMRCDKNQFALRSWIDRYPEFIADRYQKALLDEEVVVFPRAILKTVMPQSGLLHLSADQTGVILSETYSMQRRDAEENFTVIQLVSAFLVLVEDRIATYKRTKRLPEARLHGVYSLLFGGHLNPDDVPPLFSVFDPFVGPQFIQRELSEELRFSKPPSLELVGVIYDPRREVSKQHLGILYEVRVPKSVEISIGERGFLQHLQFETPHEIRARLSDFENWSELVLREHVVG